MQVNHLTSRFVYPSVFLWVFFFQTEWLPNLSPSFCYLNLNSLALISVLISVLICGEKIECFSSFAGGSLLFEGIMQLSESVLYSIKQLKISIHLGNWNSQYISSVVRLCKRYRCIELFFYMHTCKWFILVLPAWLAGQEMTHRQLTLWWLQCILD